MKCARNAPEKAGGFHLPLQKGAKCVSSMMIAVLSNLRLVCYNEGGALEPTSILLNGY